MTLNKFENLMIGCLQAVGIALRPKGRCFFVTGEVSNGRVPVNTAYILTRIAQKLGNFKCEYIAEDNVPQDRRVRKTGRRVKRECIVVLRKEE
jgi:hypothetical protein